MNVAPVASVEHCVLRPIMALTDSPDSFVYIEPMTGDGPDASADSALLGVNALATIRLAAEQIEVLLAEGSPANAIVPVSAAALLDKDAADPIAAACQALPREIRERLVFEVLGLASSFAPSQADDIAIVLYPCCRFYTARVDPQTADLKLLTACNFAGAAIDLGDQPWPDEVVRPILTTFVENAARNRLTVFVHRIGTPEIIGLAADLGVTYADGKGFEST